MSNTQARLIAASLALIAGAIMYAAHPEEPAVRIGVLFVAGVLFVVEYVRTQLPPPSDRRSTQS